MAPSGQAGFVLPGGYVTEDGAAHYDVDLCAVTGEEEQYFAGVEADEPRAAVVTGLLTRCVKRIGALDRVGAATVKDLLVGDREYLVLKLREMTLGRNVSCVLRCPQRACGKPMDLSFDLAVVDFDCSPATQRFFTAEFPVSAAPDAASVGVEFRLPTGGDQEAVAALCAADPAAAEDELLARCLRRIGERGPVDRSDVAKLPAGVRAAIEERMARLAPRAEIEIETRCPECRTPFETSFDATGFFLDELKGDAGSLDREVHLLASNYHWSEREILSLTRRRRRRYVALLREEMGRPGHGL